MNLQVAPPGTTIGVEEEFLVVDRLTGLLVPAAGLIISAAAGTGLLITPELTPTQVELVTPVCATLPDLEAVLRRQRVVAARVAHEHGLRLVASGTPALGKTAPPPLYDDVRYIRMADRFGALIAEQGTCGLHVHVGVPDHDVAVRACAYLRPALATLLAISVNSPFHEWNDTGYGSWRAILAARWPTVTPPPCLRGTAEYRREVGRLCRFGLANDESEVYWWARPSSRHATIEVRIADTQPEVADTILLVALVRALVRSALVGVHLEEAWPTGDDTQVRAAIWAAAHGGLAGSGIDPDIGGVVPHRTLLERLVLRVRPYLEEVGDWQTTQRLLSRLGELGTGADRQRAACRRAGTTGAAVEAMSLPATVE